MKITIISLLLGTLFIAFSDPEAGPEKGSKKYNQAMQAQIHLVDTAKTVNSFIAAANTFERIASAEKKEWLPAYYAAYSYLNAAMATRDLDKVDAYCDKAESLLVTSGEKKSADQSEILCLYALAYTTRIRVDMFGRGLEYITMAEKLLKDATEADPTNPRSYYLRARNVMGRPKQFGGGLEAGLPLLKIAGQRFDAKPHETKSLLPNWGRKRTKEILNAAANN
jgi:hypothetical protein